MVRHILIVNAPTTDAIPMFVKIALLAVLIAGMVLVKPEPEAYLFFPTRKRSSPPTHCHRMRVFIHSRTNHWFMGVIH